VVAITPAARKETVEAEKRIEAAEAAPEDKVAMIPPTPTAPAGGDLFNRAMGLYKDGQYADAYKTFEKVLAQNPRGDEAAETLYYMGESLYARGEYDLAILDYQKVISNHASHPRTPAALLKQAMSFEKLTDHETAKIIYKKLISEYPDSAEAGTAEEQLQALR
jgi:tol-pal system protein YbgF